MLGSVLSLSCRGHGRWCSPPKPLHRRSRVLPRRRSSADDATRRPPAWRSCTAGSCRRCPRGPEQPIRSQPQRPGERRAAEASAGEGGPAVIARTSSSPRWSVSAAGRGAPLRSPESRGARSAARHTGRWFRLGRGRGVRRGRRAARSPQRHEPSDDATCSSSTSRVRRSAPTQGRAPTVTASSGPTRSWDPGAWSCCGTRSERRRRPEGDLVVNRRRRAHRAGVHSDPGPERLAESFCSFNVPCIENASCHSSTPADPVKSAVALEQWVSGSSSHLHREPPERHGDPGQIPYLLTANHCINAPGRQQPAGLLPVHAPTAESPAARADQPGRNAAVWGDIKATGTGGDFHLMQLNQAPPGASVFLDGTNTAIANTNNAALYRISHPAGRRSPTPPGTSIRRRTPAGAPSDLHRTTTGEPAAAAAVSPVVAAAVDPSPRRRPCRAHRYIDVPGGVGLRRQRDG